MAVVWACLFARTMHLRLPWFATLILALGTSLIYITDRLLDGAPHGELKLFESGTASVRETESFGAGITSSEGRSALSKLFITKPLASTPF